MFMTQIVLHAAESPLSVAQRLFLPQMKSAGLKNRPSFGMMLHSYSLRVLKYPFNHCGFL